MFAHYIEEIGGRNRFFLSDYQHKKIVDFDTHSVKHVLEYSQTSIAM